MTDALDKPMPDLDAPKTQAILAAARAEFAEKGFAAARLDDIARAAGVAKGTIYLYFANKADLFQAVVRGYVVREIEQAETLVSIYDGSTEELLRLIAQVFREKVLETDLREIIRLLISEGRTFPDITAFYYREVISRGMAMLKGILREGVARGEFRKSAAENFPQLVIAPFLVAAIWKSLFDKFTPLDTGAMLDAHFDLLINGLRAKS